MSDINKGRSERDTPLKELGYEALTNSFNAATGGLFSRDLNVEPNNYNMVVIGTAGTGKIIYQDFLTNVVLKVNINKMRLGKL